MCKHEHDNREVKYIYKDLKGVLGVQLKCISHCKKCNMKIAKIYRNFGSLPFQYSLFMSLFSWFVFMWVDFCIFSISGLRVVSVMCLAYYNYMIIKLNPEILLKTKKWKLYVGDDNKDDKNKFHVDSATCHHVDTGEMIIRSSSDCKLEYRTECGMCHKTICKKINYSNKVLFSISALLCLAVLLGTIIILHELSVIVLILLNIVLMCYVTSFVFTFPKFALYSSKKWKLCETPEEAELYPGTDKKQTGDSQ